jgi:DNA-binding transcriptional MocR family regulator
VEDPGYSGVLDLVAARGLVAIPVAMDDDGPTPAALEGALDRGPAALVVTPRAHNPTGAALSRERAGALRRLLARHPDVVLIEDDHAGPVAGAATHTLATPARRHWAVVRSVSKWLGPDVRVAALTGDDATIGRVEGRRLLGTGWVSYGVQDLAVTLWSDVAVLRLLERAARAYEDRRRAAIAALRDHRIAAHGRSGMNVWVPVADEQEVVFGLRALGWAVQAGGRYRIDSPPAVRVTVSTLAGDDTARFAADLARVVDDPRRVATA